MRIYNTLTKDKRDFSPASGSKVKMYVCGPTVYNYIHIGNARVYVIFDMVRRFFEYRGYGVEYVSNFTDIDDKIINRAQQEGVSAEEIARKYEKAFLEDIRRLGLKHADVTPRATEHIDGMIEMISGLLARGYAYEAGGDVYFSVEKFPGYGKLSGRTLDEMKAGERVEPSPHKRFPLDFALWKASKPGEPSWDSPFGRGRPGWHIECSVMSSHYLGFGFDIHGGGQDLIFPHHENEIAQAEAYYEQEPFVRFWMHNGLLTIKSEKMAKSAGNIILIRDALDIHGPDVMKLFYLSTHYRSPLDYSPERLEETTRSLDRLLEARDRAEEALKVNGSPANDKTARLESEAKKLKSEFIASLEDDFNSARAIAAVFEFIKQLNLAVSDFSALPQKETIQRSLELLDRLLDVLGLDLERYRDFKQQAVKKNLDEHFIKLKGYAAALSVEADDFEELIEKLIEKRAQARKEKNYALADEIREKLTEAGIRIDDTPQGTRWKIV